MGTINLILPNALHDRARELAGKNKVSINQLVATSLAEKLLMLRTEENPAERSQKSHVSQAQLRLLYKAATTRPAPRATRSHEYINDRFSV